jgi:hypothetical protein
MENDIFNNIFLLFVLAMAVIGMVTSMNYIERIAGRFIRNKLNKYWDRKRHAHNMKLIRKKMNKPRAL